MKARKFKNLLLITVAAALIASCNRQPSDEQLKQQAEQATQQAKQAARQAAANAKAAAANAERQVNDVAAGVKQGLKSGNAVDINSASEEQLADLPGITGARAQKIIRGRPYGDPHDLVSKGVLTREQYERISRQVRVN